MGAACTLPWGHMLKPSALLTLFAFLTFGSAIEAASACPVINGEYEMRVRVPGGTMVYPLSFYTRNDAGVVSYAFVPEGPYFPADGVPRKFRNGDQLANLFYSCAENTLFIKTQELKTGTIYREQLTPINSTSLKLESSISEHSGIYHKN